MILEKGYYLRKTDEKEKCEEKVLKMDTSDTGWLTCDVAGIYRGVFY